MLTFAFSRATLCDAQTCGASQHLLHFRNAMRHPMIRGKSLTVILNEIFKQSVVFALQCALAAISTDPTRPGDGRWCVNLVTLSKNWGHTSGPRVPVFSARSSHRWFGSFSHSQDRMTLPYNSGPYLTRQTVSFSDLTAVSTGYLRHAYGHHSARRNPQPMASKPTCDAGFHVTLGCERPSGSICDSLAANGGGKYLPTYVRRVLAVS